jgi:hypothetical protein
MFAKLLLVILVAALAAVVLLGLRQQRLECAHRMAKLHERLNEHRQALWELRSDIARRCRPDEVRQLVNDQGQAWTILPDPAAIETETLELGSPPPRPMLSSDEAEEDLGG